MWFLRHIEIVLVVIVDMVNDGGGGGSVHDTWTLSVGGAPERTQLAGCMASDS